MRLRVEVAGIPTTAYVKAIHNGGVDVLRNGLRVENPPDDQLDILIKGPSIAGAVRARSSSDCALVLVWDEFLDVLMQD